MLARNPARFLSAPQLSGLIAQRAEVTLRPKVSPLYPDESIGLYAALEVSA